MSGNNCAFCSTLEAYKFAEVKWPEISEKRLYEYRAALIVRSWTKGKKRAAGRLTDYMRAGRGYPLNFCPVCGKPLTPTGKYKAVCRVIEERENDK